MAQTRLSVLENDVPQCRQYGQALLGGPRAELGWTEFAGRLLTRVARQHCIGSPILPFLFGLQARYFAGSCALRSRHPGSLARRQGQAFCVLPSKTPQVEVRRTSLHSFRPAASSPGESVFCFSPEVRSTKAPLGEVEAVVRG